MQGKIYLLLHAIYGLSGHLFAAACNVIWTIRDNINPPKENAVLFVAHPDDDILFFDTFISDYKPYVVCLTLGGNLQRILPFCRAMKNYAVRYRFFDMNPRDVSKTDLLTGRIKSVISKGNFTICATHNDSGEYGHIMHRCVNECVQSVWSGELLTPVNLVDIEKYPLQQETANKKKRLLKKNYAMDSLRKTCV